MTDIFHEVEEEVRREHYEKLWKTYGNYVLGACAAIVVGVASWQAWQVYDLSRREAASASFIAASSAAGTGNLAQAEAAFAGLAADGPAGYSELARFRLAQSQLAQGKRDMAIATLRGLTSESDPALSASARIQLAWLLADSAPRAEVDSLLAPLTGGDDPWRFSAREVSAYLDLQAGNRDAAASAFQLLAIEPGAPDGLRQRASAIAAFLRANRPAAAGDEETGAAGPPAEEAAPQ